MRRGRFKVTTGLLIRIQKFEVYIDKEKPIVIENLHVGCFQEMLNNFMARVAARLYLMRGKTQTEKDFFLRVCYWGVIYENGSTGQWGFWKIMTGTEKPDKNAGFQNIHVKRIKGAYYGRLYRARTKGLRPF